VRAEKMCYQKNMADSVELAFEHLPARGEAERRVLFLHGMLGSGANLRTIARRFLEARPQWDAWLIDLRGHGESPKGAPNPSLEAAAADVRELTAWSLPVGAVVGHSFGGKVALQLVRAGFGPILSRDGSALVPLAHVVTLDSNPGTSEPRREGDSALAVIDHLEALPRRFASRGDFVDALIGRGLGKSLAQWLAMSVVPDPVGPAGGVRFGLELDELRALLFSYFATDLWSVVESPPDAVNVHLVIGAKSTSYSRADRERAAAIAARNPRTTVDTLQTDHWVHAEDPDGVVRLLLQHISK
jgi:esterase